MVERLEQEGLVTRERTDEDRRGAYAVVTRAGKRAFLSTWPVYAKGIYTYFISQLDEERQVIKRGLHRIYDQLR